jgi:hypothetical protein
MCPVTCIGKILSRNGPAAYIVVVIVVAVVPVVTTAAAAAADDDDKTFCSNKTLLVYSYQVTV